MYDRDFVCLTSCNHIRTTLLTEPGCCCSQKHLQQQGPARSWCCSCGFAVPQLTPVGDSEQKGMTWSLAIALEAPSSVVGGSDSHQVQILPGRTPFPVCGVQGVCGRTDTTTAACAKHSSNIWLWLGLNPFAYMYAFFFFFSFFLFIQCSAFGTWKPAKYLPIPQTPHRPVSIKRAASRWVA